MYVNAGYRDGSRVPFKDNTKPLLVCSCGTYRLNETDKRLPTARPKGRIDYQMIYVAFGKGHFFFNGTEEIVEAGTLVLYQPWESQKYHYCPEDCPEVFWVHFTGYDVKNILEYFSIDLNRHTFAVGSQPQFKSLFQRMIMELQMCRPLYDEMLSSCLTELFMLTGRHMLESTKAFYDSYDEIERAVAFFNEHYSEKIVIEDYAASRNISKNWFTRSFKARMGMSPVQYLFSVRLSNAQVLLEQTDYSISKIAFIVGYDNPLYFTRRFTQVHGMSPTEYRKKNTVLLNKR